MAVKSVSVNENNDLALLERPALSDPAFASNKNRPIHRWVPWIAGFSSEFVKDVTNRFIESTGVVLDPFSGVGTTLVQTQLMGNKVYGFEINPYAALATKVKTEAYWFDLIQVRDEFDRFVRSYKLKEKTKYSPNSIPPDGFKTRSDFYSPAVLRKVLLIQDLIEEVQDLSIKDLFRLAFASTMVKYSNYSYEPSLGRRKSSGKDDILDYPVVDEIGKKVKTMIDDIQWIQNNQATELRRATVINDSIFNYAKYDTIEKIDAIITSPPYLNNYHYNRNTRPQVYWLGYAKGPDDMKKLEVNNFGKYWQTVRDSKKMSLEFQLKNSKLDELIDNISKVNPERGTYGGLGWANYAVSYFNDCHKMAKAMKKLLKKGGSAAVVLGNSIVQGHEIATDKYFAEICELNGLTLIGIEVPRMERVGNSIINSSVRITKAAKGNKLYESVVIVKN